MNCDANEALENRIRAAIIDSSDDEISNSSISDSDIEANLLNLSIDDTVPMPSHPKSTSRILIHEKNCYKCSRNIANDPQERLAVSCEDRYCKKILCKGCQSSNFHISDDWFCERHNKT